MSNLPEKTGKTKRKKALHNYLLTNKFGDLDEIANKTGLSKLSLVRILRDGQVPKKFHQSKLIEAQLQYDQKAMEVLLEIMENGQDKDKIAAIRELRAALYPNEVEKRQGGQTNNYYQTLIQQVEDRKGQSTKMLPFPGYDNEK